MSLIAPVGQLSTHSEQPLIQASGCTTLLTSSIMKTLGLAGQTLTHIPSPIHFISLISGFCAKIIPP